MPTLTHALTQNQSLLGTNYCHLGQTTGSGLFYKKTFLSYEGRHGWRVIQLNCLQRFFRNVLGFYHSTHLQIILEGWNRYKTGRIEFNSKKYKKIPALEKRLQELWKKSKGSVPFPSFTLTFGNQKINHAKIFAFGEKHGDKAFRKYSARIIDKYYRSGDVILVEGVAAGTFIQASKHQLTQYIRSHVKVRGWEPKNLENDSSFATTTITYAKMVATCESFIKKIPKKKKFTQVEFQRLEQQTHTFFKEELMPFYQFFFPDPKIREKNIQFGELLLKNCFSSLKKNKNKDTRFIVMCLLKLGSELEKQQEKVRYKNLSFSAAKKILADVQARNDSLCHELNQYARRGRRVFVLGGALHFFKNSLADCEKVVNTMKQHGFVLTTTNRVYQDYALDRVQSGYNTIPAL